ncbi:MAG: hypothetical protein BAW33_03810 [Desulfobacterales bacterium C00003104]|nr:MAG: hypothetical protein BAW33_03810 [Desulfobacterales bacterium C00003104]
MLFWKLFRKDIGLQISSKSVKPDDFSSRVSERFSVLYRLISNHLFSGISSFFIIDPHGLNN